jgi:hypothetical protein
MSRKRRRDDYLDARVNQTAVDLFRLGKKMLAEGFATNSVEFHEVCHGLDRALDLRPWMPSPFDFELYIMEPQRYPPHAAFQVVQQLHRRLVAAA